MKKKMIFHDYKHGCLRTKAIGLYTTEGYAAPRRENDGTRWCKKRSRDRGGRRKWRGKGKGKREMKRTERCGERTEREIREKKKEE